ncbi:MAG: Xaa-Pro peptidase family protein, partial [Bacillota bacterium]|nr:Xaa-Pro peptidase family protein [Bacillota bacterium]
PLEMIPEAINELGLGAARIGCELGEFQRLGISYNDLCDVKKALPQAEFVDAASIFNYIRMVKTPQEVQYIKKACDLALEAWDIMLQQIHIGMHSSEAYRILQLAMFDVGGQGGHISLGLEGDAYSHTFQAGDWLWSDFGTQYKGYGSDLARMAIFGDPTDENKRDFDMIWELLRKLMERIGPGVRCSDLARQTNEDMRKMGLKPLDAQKRVGHGFGVTSDPPSIGLADDTILEPGMVLTPEPRFFIASGQRMHIEEDVVVTEKGCDLLSTGAERLIVLK